MWLTSKWAMPIILLLLLIIALAGVHFQLWPLWGALPCWLGLYLSREAWVLVYNVWGWGFSRCSSIQKAKHKQKVIEFSTEVLTFVSASIFIWPAPAAF